MWRGACAVLSALVLTACASAASPSVLSAPPETPTVTPTSVATPASIAPTPLTDAPATAGASAHATAEEHVAAGLAFARFPSGGGSASELFVVDADGEIRQLTGLDPAGAIGASLPVWSPDRSALAFGPPKIGAGPVRYLSVVNIDGSNAHHVAPLGDEFGVPFSWSPDGTRILFFDIDAVNGPAMRLADAATGEVTVLGAGHLPRWLPDGGRISFQRPIESDDPADLGAMVGVVWLLTIADGQTIEFARVSDAIWSPDGTAVVLQHPDGALFVADADGTDPRYVADGFSPAWSPDGQHLVFGYRHDNDGVPLLALIDRTGQTVWSGARGASPSWSPDGARLAVEIAFPDLAIHILDAESGELLWQVEGMQPSWTP